MDIAKELDVYLRSRVTLMCVVSYEEGRVVKALTELCKKGNRSLYQWDHADFFTHLGGPEGSPPKAKDPLSALDAVEKLPHDAVLILRDFHQCWHNQPRVIRKLRNLAQSLKYTRKNLVVTTPVNAVPDELKDDAVLFEVTPPGFAELSGILQHLLATPNVKINLDKKGMERIIRSALGLSSNQAQRVFAKAIVSEGVLDEKDLDLINQEKKQIIKESGALEFFTPRETISDVGGLDVLKDWLALRERANSREARAYGLPIPKGVALIGIPGTGKSLSAKMIAGLWRQPLIRLDIGALFGSLVGQSEENCRRALAIAETVSPCVLWIDELEKGLSTGDGDGGTSMRVFGTILSWMQEKTRPVFVVATANNISRLPPELLRRGRFDEIFFLDLPTREEREEIFKVHIKKRKRKPENFDLQALVSGSEGFVGAEIEQSVIDAMYVAFNDRTQPGREFTTSDITVAMEKLVPMSRSQREVITELRQWLVEGRAQSASFKEAKEAEHSFVPIQIDPSVH